MSVETRVSTENLTVEDVLTVYSGKPGCMCGCRGNYKYRAQDVELGKANRGYAIRPEEISDVAVKRMVNKFKKEGSAMTDMVPGRGYKYVFIETETRVNVIHFKETKINAL